MFVTEDVGDRLDSYLTERFETLSRSKIQKLIKSHDVLVNGKPQKPSYAVNFMDSIVINLKTDEPIKLNPQNIPLDIVYEDENMLVVNKPSDMLTHPTAQETENTLVNALLYKYGDNLSDLNGDMRRGIIHRLDRNTSGLLMVAKNNDAHAYLAEQIKNRSIVKEYLGIVKGQLKDDFGIIDAPLGRNPKNPTKNAVIDDGKPSITEYKVLERFKECTYVEFNLITGRTHQIRVHSSYLNHPILNDTLYGGGGFKIKTQEQVLQSYKLEFAKPFCGDIIKLQIDEDEKIKKVLNWLKNKETK